MPIMHDELRSDKTDMPCRDEHEKGHRLHIPLTGYSAGSNIIIESAAGWNEFFDTNSGEISLPVGSLTAASILPAKEAFVGEKQEIVNFIDTYIREVFQQTGTVDVAMTIDRLYRIGRAGKDYVFLPPHVASASHDEAEAFFVNLLSDLRSSIPNGYPEDFLHQLIGLIDSLLSKMSR